MVDHVAMEHPYPRVIRHQRHLRTLVLAQQIGVGEVRRDLVPVRRNHLETHAVQVDRVLILGHVLQFEDIALAQLQAGNRPIGAGLVRDVPGLAVDLPQARWLAVVDIHRHRTDPFEIEVEFFGIRQIRLGHRVGGQGFRPRGRRIVIGHRAQGSQSHRAVAQRQLFTGRWRLDRQTNTHARAEPVFLAQRPRLDRVAVQRIDLRFNAGDVDAIRQGVVEIEQTHAGDLPRRQLDHRHWYAVDGRQAPRRTATRRFTGDAELDEIALLVNVPVLQTQGLFVLETGRLALFDNQRPDQPAAQLLAAADVRVIPVAAGVRHAEFVIEVFTGQHRQLRDVRHTVHLQRQTDAVPVNGGRHRQMVDETHPQPLALTHTQFGARRRWAERPGLGLVPRHQLNIQWRRDQLVVVARVSVGHLAQPVTRRTSRSDTNDNKTGQATEDLATGKGHELNYLTYLRRAPGTGPAKGKYDTPAIAKQ
ncbi:hypothetical protein EMIT093MI4_60221 [Pseudomonas sp. IT-93MI4]